MDFYVSGICYAKFDPFNQDTPVSVLDVSTGEYMPA